jgi:uncharacterized protein
MSDSSNYYVYVYIDPRNHEEFYYGKGTGDRRYAHLNDDKDTEKATRIKEICACGLEPDIKVIARNLTAHDALLIEKTLIWKLGRQLTNVSSGHFSEEFRPHNTMHLKLYGFDYQNGIYYFNIGEGPRRCWADCRKYGFISAGGGKLWGEQIQSLFVGDVVAAYLSGRGYVGIGIITEPAAMAKDFRVENKRLSELDLECKGILDRADDPAYAEYIARVEWKASCDSHEAKWARKKGLFTARMAKASLQNQPKTLSFVSDAFNIDLQNLLNKSFTAKPNTDFENC